MYRVQKSSSYLQSSSLSSAARSLPPARLGCPSMTVPVQDGGRCVRWRGCPRGTDSSYVSHAFLVLFSSGIGSLCFDGALPLGGRSKGQAMWKNVPYWHRSVTRRHTSAKLALIPYILFPAVFDQLFIYGRRFCQSSFLGIRLASIERVVV